VVAVAQEEIKKWEKITEIKLTLRKENDFSFVACFAIRLSDRR